MIKLAYKLSYSYFTDEFDLNHESNLLSCFGHISYVLDA